MLDAETAIEWKHPYWANPEYQEVFDRVFLHYPRPGRKAVAMKAFREAIDGQTWTMGEWQGFDAIAIFMDNEFHSVLDDWQEHWENIEGRVEVGHLPYLSTYLIDGMWRLRPPQYFFEVYGVPPDKVHEWVAVPDAEPDPDEPDGPVLAPPVAVAPSDDAEPAFC